jgi:hypothetical protein
MRVLPALLVLALVPRPADACSCQRPQIEVWPVATVAAPTNTHVWLAYPPAAGAPPAAADLGLRVRGASPPVPVAIDVRESGAASRRVYELIPRAPLTARTRYEVTAARADGKPAEVIGEITVGEKADETPPAWEGIERARLFHPPAHCCDCSTGDAYVVLDLRPPTDDATSAERLVWAVWLGDGKGKIDFAQPPVTTVAAWGSTIVLGHKSSCAPANLVFPPKGRARVGLRPLDLAGNAGKPSEIEVEIE